VIVRRLLVLAAAIGLAFVASLALIERATRPAVPGAPPATQGPAAPLGSSPAAPPAPPHVRRELAGTIPAPPEPLADRVARPRHARGAAPVPAPRGVPRVEFSFRLDPRLTGGLHMGNRWVSPRTYTRTGDSKTVSVEARARVVGGPPQRSRANVAWAASEPDMVEVTPRQGDEVELTVWRPGESRVTASAGGASGRLTIRAAEVGGALRVDIVR
jgi:hypothetical protein